MIFDNLEEYNRELVEIKSRLNDMEKRMNENPKRCWIKGNYTTLKNIHEIILKDREEFLKLMVDNAYFNVNDHIARKDFSLPIISEIFGGLNSFTSDISGMLKDGLNVTCNNLIPVKKVSSGSLHLTFSMGDEKTNLDEVMLNYQVFNVLFDILECSESELPYLKDKIGDKCLESYKNFLQVFIKHKLSFSLENSTRKVHFTPDDALNVFNILSKEE